MSVTEKVKNIGSKIRGAIKFFSTFIGQIVFWTIALLLLVLLVYIIVTVILKDIAKILGIEGGVPSDDASAQLYKDLATSGYSQLLNANELAEYYAFEYAVLMDAARFLEETGTKPVSVGNQAEIILEDFTGDRETWAYLNAVSLAGSYLKSGQADPGEVALIAAGEGKIATTQAAKAAEREAAEAAAAAGGAGSSDNPGGDKYNNGFINIEEFSGDHAKENLFYYTVKNEITGDVSLIPYLEITREADTVTYYVEYREENDAAKRDDMFNKGITFTLGNMGFVYASRFECGENAENYINAGGFDNSYKYILEHLFPAQICSELNANNLAAYEKKDRVYGSNTEKIDLYKNYSQGLYYGTTGVLTEHKIPLKILLERFMPNASLLSSWRILSDREEADNLVYEIQKIYSEACLKDEEASGDKLLVKDVFKISANIDEETKAIDLIGKTALQDTTLEKYLDDKETLKLYNSYEALFDSRTLEPKEGEAAEKKEESKEEKNEETKNGMPTKSAQSFEGGFSGDVIDDIKLVLTHFSKNNSIGMSKNTFERLIKDAQKVIKPSEGTPISANVNNLKNGEYIIYTPIANGKYLVECNALYDNTEFRKHYNLKNDDDVSDKTKIMKEKDHEYNTDPYAAPENMQGCFVPFMKVAYTLENGLRTTSIIISYKNNYYGYIVKGKEIDDLSKLSNKNTFAYFESCDMQSTKPRHWVITGEGEKSNEKWVIEDAFEGAGITLGNISLNLNYTIAGVPETKKVSGTLEQWCNYLGTDTAGLLEDAFGKSAILSPNDLAIIRTPSDPLSRDYTGLLELPTNASLSAEGLANYQYNTDNVGMSGGESSVLDKYYINLKALGLKEGDPVDINGMLASAIRGRLGNLERLCYLAIYYDSSFNIGRKYSNADYEMASQNAVAQQISYNGKGALNVNADIVDYSVVMPVRRYIIPITQEIWDKKMRFYLVGGAKTWSGIKMFNNNLTVNGRYEDRGNWIYIINSNPYCTGLSQYSCWKDVRWRAELFAPIFAGKDDKNTKTRESDVQMILAQWVEAGDNGIRAADYYVRDLYNLINFSKGVTSGDKVIAEPIYRDKANKKPYVHPDSYTYLYIPDEILLFDETTAEKAFWQDRLICTTNDDIDQSTENYLRSRMPTFTWQIVDYDLYDECRNEDGTSSVYLLWMFGDQMSRLLYAMSANVSEAENDIVDFWGGYSNLHQAADLYGRTQSAKIYNEIFDKEGNARIQSTYDNGKVRLIGTDSTEGEGALVGDNELIYLNDVGGSGLYRKNQETHLILDGVDYKFNGTIAAVYGYELYRLTGIYKSPEKAEAELKAQLKKEITWTELRAVAPGIVKEVNCNAGGGFVVKIQHANGTASSYSHMKRYPLVQKGQYVGAGTVLGYEGTTGNSNGHHVHFSISIEGEYKSPNPVYYLYPFFTPFYYEEKAAEAGYALDSDYMSIARTVFPYGEVVGANIPTKGEELDDSLKVIQNNQGKIDSGDNFPFAYKDEDGILVIQNYIPFRIFIDDSQKLYSETNDPENIWIDYSKPSENDKNNLGSVTYNGEILKTNPDYFDEEFHEYVKQNYNKITPIDNADELFKDKNTNSSTGEDEEEENGNENEYDSTTDTEFVYTNYSPNDFGQNKPVMDKNSYTDADWARMEAELKFRVEQAGFGTRAGAVEAALYLASLDYSVPYRGTPLDKNGSDYLKIGLNRNWGDKVKLSKNVTAYGKEYKKGNKYTCGMDCSAFVAWALINGGVIEEGNGAGGPQTNFYTNTPGSLSGRMQSALGYSHTKAHALSSVADEVEPGDIALTYGTRNGKKGWTHVGLVVGVDKDNVYIAEENTTTHLSGEEKVKGITVNKLVVTQIPKTYKGDRLGYIVLCDDKLYKAKNPDGTENKGNMPIVWGN